MSRPSTEQGAQYVETVRAPWSAWPIGAGFAVSMGIVFLPVHPVAALAAIVFSGGFVGAMLRNWRLVLQVEGGDLVAGPARVPLGLVGEVTELDPAAMRVARGTGLDARAYLALRGWVPTGIRVELLDPADPTPYWLLSSREPAALAAAVRAARTGASGDTQAP